MVSPALVITYLFLVLVVVCGVVLFCLGCGCHVPLGKCVRCFCSNTTFCCNRCCKRKRKGDDGYKNIMDDVNDENAAKDEASGAQEARQGRHGHRGVLRVGAVGFNLWHVLWRLQGRGGEAAAPAGKGVAVAQPVPTNAHDLEDEVVGTEPVVAISMPLLSIH